MSQENVEIVRGIYADPGGLTAGASGRVAPNAEFDFSAVYLDSPIVRGLEELRRFREGGPWSGSPVHFEPELFFDVDDDRVLVFARVSVTVTRAVRKSRCRLRTSSRFGTSWWCASRCTQSR